MELFTVTRASITGIKNDKQKHLSDALFHPEARIDSVGDSHKYCRAKQAKTGIPSVQDSPLLKVE